MQGNQLFKGVGVALVTLFDTSGALDAPASADLAARLVGLGVTAVIVAGTTGEAAALDIDERTELLAAVRKVVPDGGAVPVIAGTGAPTTEQALRLTRSAIDAGADAVLTMALPGAADQRPYYQAVADVAGDVPVFAYHFPNVSSPGIDVDQLGELPVAGLKDSSGDPANLLAALDGWDRPVYSGSPALITMAGAVGCTGMILGLANSDPEGCIAAFDGDGAAQLRLAKAVRATAHNFPASLKHLVSERFGVSDVTRAR